MSKFKKVLREPEKRLPADMMLDDKKIQGKIKKQFDKQNVSLQLSPNYILIKNFIP